MSTCSCHYWYFEVEGKRSKKFETYEKMHSYIRKFHREDLKQGIEVNTFSVMYQEANLPCSN